MTTTARQDTVWQVTGLADTYLDGVRGAIPLAAEQIDILVRLCRAARPQARALLDLGCGDGILGHALLDAYSGNDMTAVFADFSPRMLDAAQLRLSGYAAHFVQVDYAYSNWVDNVCHALPDAAPGFDIIVSGFSIHHQPDTRKRIIYEEIYNILTPGGIFLNLEHVASASDWGEEQFETYFIDSLYRYHKERGKTRDEVAADFYHRPDKVANLLTSVEKQLGWLRELGYTNVDCFLKIFELALFGGLKPAEG